MDDFASARKPSQITLPFSLDAEQSVLGAILYDNRNFGPVEEKISGRHFYSEEHGRIFDLCSDLIRAGSLADGITLRERFLRPDFEGVGGPRYLLTLLENAARMPVHAIEYAAHIAELAVKRDIIRAGLAMIEAASDAEIRAADTLIEAQRGLADINSDTGSPDVWKSAGEIAVEAVERASEGRAKGISTGLASVDDCTGGGRPGTLWVVGGATSMGKSIIGQQFAVNVAKQNFGVAYVHLEMDVEEVGLRLASGLAFERERLNYAGEGGNPHYLSAVRQKLKPAQWDRMRKAAMEVAPTLKIYVDDRPGRTITQIESAVRALFQRMRHDNVEPGLIVVDHEGLIAASQKHPSELEAARARGNGLKDMAKRLGVWTVALSQITKEGSRADGDDRLPTSQDLNYGSALSQAAHVIILVHRKAYYAERKPASKWPQDNVDAMSRDATLVIDKARGGRRAQIEALMDVASAVLIERKEAIAI